LITKKKKLTLVGLHNIINLKVTLNIKIYENQFIEYISAEAFQHLLNTFQQNTFQEVIYWIHSIKKILCYIFLIECWCYKQTT